MFSSPKKNQNRRRPAAGKKAGRKRSASKEALFDDQEYEKLHAKIGVLEDFITNSAVKQDYRSRMRAKNIMPPPEQWQKSGSSRAGGATVSRRSRWEQRQENSRRERSGLTFLLLFGAACALGWWLLNSGI